MYYLNVTETNFDNLWKLILICNLIVLVPLPLVINMKVDEAQDIAVKYKRKKGCEEAEQAEEDEESKPFIGKEKKEESFYSCDS